MSATNDGTTSPSLPDGTRIRLFVEGSELDMHDEMDSFQRTLHLDRRDAPSGGA